MQAATQRPVNLGLRRIEHYLQTPVLAVVLRVGKRSNENNQSCNDAGRLNLIRLGRLPGRYVPKQKIS